MSAAAARHPFLGGSWLALTPAEERRAPTDEAPVPLPRVVYRLGADGVVDESVRERAAEGVVLSPRDPRAARRQQQQQQQQQTTALSLPLLRHDRFSLFRAEGDAPRDIFIAGLRSGTSEDMLRSDLREYGVIYAVSFTSDCLGATVSFLHASDAASAAAVLSRATLGGVLVACTIDENGAARDEYEASVAAARAAAEPAPRHGHSHRFVELTGNGEPVESFLADKERLARLVAELQRGTFDDDRFHVPRETPARGSSGRSSGSRRHDGDWRGYDAHGSSSRGWGSDSAPPAAPDSLQRSGAQPLPPPHYARLDAPPPLPPPPPPPAMMMAAMSSAPPPFAGAVVPPLPPPPAPPPFSAMAPASSSSRSFSAHRGGAPGNECSLRLGTANAAFVERVTEFLTQRGFRLRNKFVSERENFFVLLFTGHSQCRAAHHRVVEEVLPTAPEALRSVQVREVDFDFAAANASAGAAASISKLGTVAPTSQLSLLKERLQMGFQYQQQQRPAAPAAAAPAAPRPASFGGGGSSSSSNSRRERPASPPARAPRAAADDERRPREHSSRDRPLSPPAPAGERVSRRSAAVKEEAEERAASSSRLSSQAEPLQRPSSARVEEERKATPPPPPPLPAPAPAPVAALAEVTPMSRKRALLLSAAGELPADDGRAGNGGGAASPARAEASVPRLVSSPKRKAIARAPPPRNGSSAKGRAGARRRAVQSSDDDHASDKSDDGARRKALGQQRPEKGGGDRSDSDVGGGPAPGAGALQRRDSDVATAGAEASSSDDSEPRQPAAARRGARGAGKARAGAGGAKRAAPASAKAAKAASGRKRRSASVADAAEPAAAADDQHRGDDVDDNDADDATNAAPPSADANVEEAADGTEPATLRPYVPHVVDSVRLCAAREDAFWLAALQFYRDYRVLARAPSEAAAGARADADDAASCARVEPFKTFSALEKRRQRKKFAGLLNESTPYGVTRSAVEAGRAARVESRRVRLALSGVNDEDLQRFADMSARSKVKFGPSSIHNWGLFATEDIKQGEMVCEYVGEVVRARVADLREKRYQLKGIGSSYLFKIDDDYVVDATVKGNDARFTNHRCESNCDARIITIPNACKQLEQRIIFTATRDIFKGQEITYDYHFPLEDEKIPCHCGAPNCRGTLN